MQKIWAVLLSVSLLTGAVSPSLLQAKTNAAAQQARLQQALDGATLKAKQKRVITVGEIRQAARELTSSAPQDEYQTFKTLYLDILNEEKNQALFTYPDQAGTIEKTVAKWKEEAQIKSAWKNFKSSPAYQTWQKDQQTQAKNYVGMLASAAIKYAQKNPVSGAKLVAEVLPIFAAAGAVTAENKKQASSILRTYINEHKGVCGGVGLISGIKARFGYDEDVKTQTKACEDILASAAALSVLGQDGSRGLNADTEALGGLLASGYNGIMGPAVIMTVSQGLLAMNGERALTAELIEISRKLPDIGLLGNDLSFLSVGDWVKAATVLKGDYAIGLEYSFYKGSNGKGNLNNAWVDLGMYLAQYGGKGGKYVLDRVVGDSVWYGTNGLPGVKFKPFVTGALAGGYRIEKGGEVYERLGKDGRGYRVDTRKEYAQAKAAMAKAGLNESGYFAASLYYSGKDDLDPYTRVYINNLLAAGYKKTGNKTALKGMGQRTRPTQAEIAGYASAQKAIKAGRVVDIVLVVVFTTKLAASAVKLGVQGIKNGVRVLRLARAGNAVNGLGIGKNLSRVIRIGRLQKYGVASAKEVIAGSLRNTLNVQSILPKPAVKTLKPAAGGKTPAANTVYQTKPADFARPEFNKQAALAKAKAARINAAKKPLSSAEVKARELAQARKDAALRTAQAKQARAQQIDQELIQQVQQKAQLDAAWKQTDAYKAQQAAAHARYARQLAFDAKIDKWTFGKGSRALKLIRDRAFALNLSLLLNMSSPDAIMAARGAAPLRAAAQTEWVQTLSRTGQAAKTLRLKPVTLQAKPITRAPFYVTEPSKMNLLSFGRWGERGLHTPGWFKLPQTLQVFTPVKSAVKTVKPVLAPVWLTQPSPWHKLYSEPEKPGNSSGYLYGGLPFFSLAKLVQKAAAGLKNIFPQSYNASRYTLYSVSLLMGLDVASPLLTDIGRSLALNMDDNSWVTVATFLPYFIGAMINEKLHNTLGAKRTLGLGLALSIGGLASGVFLCGLDGSFAPEIDTMAHFQRILISIAATSLGMILIQNSVGTVLEHLARKTPQMNALPESARADSLERDNIKMQVFRSIGIILTYLFPWISAALLHKDWSFSFVIPVPFMVLGAGVFLMANLPNLKGSDVEEPAQAPTQAENAPQEVKTAATPRSFWDKIKNNSYVSLFKEEPAAKYLGMAAFLMNVIEVTIHNGLMFILPGMDISDSERYILTMVQYAAAFLTGRMISPWVLNKFPNYRLSISTLVALSGIALSLPFSQSNAYLFTAGLTIAQIGISCLFSLLFGAAARNPKTQARMVSLIIASAISCAIGPLALANMGQWFINTGLLGERAATTVALIAAPCIMAVIANALLYKMEKNTFKNTKQKNKQKDPPSQEQAAQ